MNQHLGATYTLSVLVVVAFAVAFHRVGERAGPPKPANKVSARGIESRPEPARPEVAAAPARPPVEAKPTARVEIVRPKVAAVEHAPPKEPRPAVRPVSEVKERHRGAFARVEPGESLADVALRLYGSPTMAEALWKANRDQVSSSSTPLEAGMTLRTP